MEHERKDRNTGAKNNRLDNLIEYVLGLEEKANQPFPEYILSELEEEVIFVDFSSFVAKRNEFNEYKRQLDWLQAVLSECEMVEVAFASNLIPDNQYGTYFTGSTTNTILFTAYLEAQGLLFAFRKNAADNVDDVSEEIPADVAKEIAESMGDV